MHTSDDKSIPFELPLPIGAPTAQDLWEVAASLRSAAFRSRSSINLVPSENRLSPLAHLPLSTDFYNRYFFNQAVDPGFWQFRGGQPVHELETALANDCLARLSDAVYVNTRAISGMSAMMMAVVGLAGERPSAVVTVAESSGGHFATADLVNIFGFRSLTVGIRNGRVDEQQLVDALLHQSVSLVYLDLQNSLHELDVASVSKLIKQHSPATVLHVDCSHTLGLILGGAHGNPLDLGADCMGGSTHKTFPGPQKGALFTRDERIASHLRQAQYNLVSSHHFAETLSLGLAAAEFEHFGPAYSTQVIRNAQTLAEGLSAEGFEVVQADNKAFTHTHQVWVTLAGEGQVDRLSERLYRGGIRVNVQTNVPGLKGPVLRLGVAEATFEGATSDSMKSLTALMARARYVGLPATAAQEIQKTFGSPYFYDELPAGITEGHGAPVGGDRHVNDR